MAAHQLMMAEHFEQQRRKKNKEPDIPLTLDRSKLKLTISDHDATYMSGILSLQFINQPSHLPDADRLWGKHVVWFAGIPRPYANNNHAYTLAPLPKGTGFPIWIDTSIIGSEPSKSYIQALFEEQCSKRGLILCYWWNIKPTLRPDSGETYLWIDNSSDLMRIAFAAAPPIPK